MIAIAEIQAYLRQSAQQQYECVSLPGFLACFHPTMALIFFNYAIPDASSADRWPTSIDQLKAAFISRERTPRLEFIEEYAPTLPRQLIDAGFSEEGRQVGMVCTRETFRSAPNVDGLNIIDLPSDAPSEQIRTFLMTQEQGFCLENVPELKTDQDAESFRVMIGNGMAYIAFIGNIAVGVGMNTPPFQGITEIVGVATLDKYRRQGVASAIMTTVIRNAFAQGVETIYLTAADQRAGQVYQRLGFAPALTMLSYVLL